MIPVPNPAIKIILCPESRPTQIQQPIRFVGAAALNAPDRRSKILIAQGAKRDVYVIGHEYPRAQFISGLVAAF
jgi:hypothetical protein